MNNLKNDIDIKLNKIRKYEGIIAFARLIFVVLAIVLILAGYFASKGYLYPVGFILLIPFIASIIIHSRLYKMDKLLSYKLDAIKDYDRRRKGINTSFKDSGEEFISKDNFFEADLDIFGKNSLYEYMTVAKTGKGREAFANCLKDIEFREDEIRARQAAVEELASDIDMNISLIARLKGYGANVSDNKPKSMDNALNNIENKITYNKLKLIPAVLVEIGLVVSIILTALHIVSPLAIFIMLGLNFFLTMYFAAPIKEVRASLIPINNLFYGYDDIIGEILSHEYKSDYLNKIKGSLSGVDAKALRRLNSLEPWISSGHNILFEIIFNGLFGFDTWMVLLYDMWQKRYKNLVRGVVLSVAELEALLSLSVLKVTDSDAIMPSISDKFEFKNLRHPLINKKSCVGNDFKFQGMNIITGSNMSGKTTFMRSIGISYIMFKAGGYVLADEFSAGIYKLFTSMKVTDSVSSGLSTFYAEILRVKSIVEYSDKGMPMLVLVDEIFKGTNTLDRIKGAREVIKTLNKDYIYSIITTHDFELCDTENAKNYHFKEYYLNDEIKFDYKILDGRSETTNAIYLLKMSGIIKE